jgi:hypothetical protein
MKMFAAKPMVPFGKRAESRPGLSAISKNAISLESCEYRPFGCGAGELQGTRS